MVPATKKVGTWLGLRAPYITLIVLMSVFAVVGSVSIDGEWGYQISAGVIVVLMTGSIIFPKTKWLVISADIMMILWSFGWGLNVYEDLYPKRVGLFGILTYPAIGIFVGFSSPLRERLTRPRRLVRRTPNYGENLTPHFSSTKKRQVD